MIIASHGPGAAFFGDQANLEIAIAVALAASDPNQMIFDFDSAPPSPVDRAVRDYAPDNTRVARQIEGSGI